MLTVQQIYDWATEQLHESSADTVLSNTLLLRWVNEGLQEVATAAKWKWLEAQREFTLGGHGAGANTSLGVTYLPGFIQQIEDLWPTGLGYRAAIMVVGAWELDMLGASATGGLANYLSVWGYYAVARDNPAANQIVVADTGGSTAQVVIEGIDNVTGTEISETLTLVAGAATTTATYAAGPDGVRRIYVVEPATGMGVVTFTSGAVQIERINAGAGERIHERLRTELVPAPTAGTSNFIIRYYKRIRPVLAVTNVVDIPWEFENLLFHAVGRRLGQFRKDMSEVALHQQSFMQRVRDLKAWQNRQGGRMRGMRGLTQYGYTHYRGW